MKDIDKKDAPDVSGGFSPDDSGCSPRFPFSIDYPPNPDMPFPEPPRSFDDPVPVVNVK